MTNWEIKTFAGPADVLTCAAAAESIRPESRNVSPADRAGSLAQHGTAKLRGQSMRWRKK